MSTWRHTTYVLKDVSTLIWSYLCSQLPSPYTSLRQQHCIGDSYGSSCDDTGTSSGPELKEAWQRWAIPRHFKGQGRTDHTSYTNPGVTNHPTNVPSRCCILFIFISYLVIRIFPQTNSKPEDLSSIQSVLLICVMVNSCCILNGLLIGILIQNANDVHTVYSIPLHTIGLMFFSYSTLRNLLVRSGSRIFGQACGDASFQ